MPLTTLARKLARPADCTTIVRTIIGIATSLHHQHRHRIVDVDVQHGPGPEDAIHAHTLAVARDL